MSSKLKQFICLTVSALFTLTIQAQVNPTPAGERMQGLDQRRKLQSRSLLNDIQFRNIGPTIRSGRVVDVDANPEDPTEFYVAYATGGLWYTTNNGQSFTPIMDSLDMLFIGDIAVNWTNKTRIIWVGTGEVNSSRSSYSGIGMYKSSNNGKTWEYLGLPESHHIGKVQLHPSNPDIAWVAALGHLYSANKDRGVYKTTDGGKTWKQFRPTDKKSEWIHGDNHAMWFDAANPDRIILGNDGGVSTTMDGGAKWNNFFDKIPTTQFYTVTYDMQSPFNVFGSIQDEGTFSGSINNTFGKPQDSTIRSWDYAPGGEGTQIQVDPQDHNIVFSSSFYGRLMKSDMSKPDSVQNERIKMFAVGAIDSLRGEWLAGTL